MPLQNRVLPTGEIVVHPARGAFMGNRGILHDDRQRLGRKRWAHRNWITCLLDFKERRRPLMAPRSYTELFFHDEAVALAAGHRPCAECRRRDYTRYREAAGVPGTALELDRILHAERAVPRLFRQRTHRAELDDLPGGTFVMSDTGQPFLIWQDCLLPFKPPGYGAKLPLPRGMTTVLTPPTSVRALREGYRPVVMLR